MGVAILESKLVCDIAGKFCIPDYQRGYRWKKEEVKMLLNDIIDNGDKSYCLQPIVIKKLGDNELGENKYELIDGQQRLTTLYILLNFIKKEKYKPRIGIPFSLEYKIREKSKEYLENITSENKDECIDFFYIYEAYETIGQWIKNKKNCSEIVDDLYRYLCKRVKVIWYEVNSEENSSLLFTRLNIGRIPLTNAELIKALFLCRKDGLDDAKQLEIATSWDIIERELHNDSFWCFLTNENAEKYATRIELVFDLMSERKSDEIEKFFTFFYFDNEIKNGKKKIELWSEIKKYYLLLKEWFENNNLYHKIGYLIASNYISLKELISYSKDKTKSDFDSLLDNKISESINFNKDYCDLTYDKDYDNIGKILLLFNIETIRKKQDTNIRYPFNKHKQKDCWSLEHIHARSSEGLNTDNKRCEWLVLHLESLKDVKKNLGRNSEMKLLKDVEDISKLSSELSLAIDKYKRKIVSNAKADVVDFDDLFNRTIMALSPQGDTSYIDTLSNMALLSVDDNSAISNSAFDVKRNIILKKDKEGDYIPICTRNVFLKYYTDSEKNQLYFWGEDDRKAYLGAMNNILGKYLTIIKKEIK